MKKSNYIPQRYNTDNNFVNQLKEYYTTGKYLDRWYCIAPKTFVYFNVRGYYHVVKITRMSTNGKIELDDYIVRENGELKRANRGYEFDSKTEFEQFLIDEHSFKHEEENAQ